MIPGSPQALRLIFKRTFVAYFLALQSPGIADPTEAFAACHEYLSALRAQLGAEEFMRRLDDETTHLAGQIEQDLRRGEKKNGAPRRGAPSAYPSPIYEDLEDRMRECFEHGLNRMG